MKRNRSKNISVASEDLTGAESTRTHFRRCHICGTVTENEGKAVQRCTHCGKAMAPFYFFDEDKVDALSESDPRPVVLPGLRSPVRGLTAYW
jgi:rRNA maturation endonuclease Nob1